MADLVYLPGAVVGQIATSSALTTGVYKTAYTEQTTNAQRSFASSSANDTSAGTGARTLTLTYLDQTGAGPFTETITMNGASNVNTASSTICFIESIVVATVGSGGSNAGTITMKAAAAGGGATIITIAIGDNRTKMAQHYVPLGKTCYVTDWSAASLVNASTAGAQAYIATRPLSSFERDLTPRLHYIGNIGALVVPLMTPFVVAGPTRLLFYIITEAATANTHSAEFSFFEL